MTDENPIQRVGEGQTRRFKKACSCWPATASGPRIVIGPMWEDEGFFAEARLELMACDKCDKPWEEVS